MGRNQLEKLVRLMARLRSSRGCPWDRKQTHSSIKKHLIEEAYEVCEAMDAKDPERFKDELGDLLFQVIFHAQMAKERGCFDINDILKNTYNKMLRRHPHVFGRRRAKNAEEAYRRWQEKKDQEGRGSKGRKTLLYDVPEALPALIKAQKVSIRASGCGFDWPHMRAVLEKVEEELAEIKKALKTSGKNHLKEEMGDILFAIVNLARFGGIDAEDALNKATKKFSKRFQRMRDELKRRGRDIADCSMRELDGLWELRKNA
jgi:tetrapyrrole methylase family protein/MazG family protein